QHLNGLIEIGDKKYSFKEEMWACRVRFVPNDKQGWGVSKNFDYTTNFDTTFLDAFVEKAQQFL
ncbi:hypothetical protein L4C31_20060, partial [Aliivibrio sifiae]